LQFGLCRSIVSNPWLRRHLPTNRSYIWLNQSQLWYLHFSLHPTVDSNHPSPFLPRFRTQPQRITLTTMHLQFHYLVFTLQIYYLLLVLLDRIRLFFNLIHLSVVIQGCSGFSPLLLHFGQRYLVPLYFRFEFDYFLIIVIFLCSLVVYIGHF
jgi:hypothetical protein